MLKKKLNKKLRVKLFVFKNLSEMLVKDNSLSLQQQRLLHQHLVVGVKRNIGIAEDGCRYVG